MKKPRQYIIVDDDRTNNLICEYAVKGFDSRALVKTFTDPGLALADIKNSIHEDDGPISNLFFIDVNMPSMSGWEFLKELEKDIEILDRITVYILSSSIEDFSKEKKEFPYVTDFLSKPLSKDKLEQLEKNW